MHVSRLHLHQFRSHEDAIFDFDPRVTAIIGPNGSGKTNILEAIYTLCMGKSFRDGDDDLITYEHDWYRIEAMVDDVNRELRYQPSNKGKQLMIDGTSKGRVDPAGVVKWCVRNKYPLVALAANAPPWLLEFDEPHFHFGPLPAPPATTAPAE